MALQTIFGSCFMFSAEPTGQNGQSRSIDEVETPRISHARSRSERSIFNWGRAEEPEQIQENRSPTPFPLITVEEVPPVPQRPQAVRSHSCPSSTRDAQRGNSPYGPKLTIHDAHAANQLLGSTSSLGNGQYSFLNGEFIPRPLSGMSNHSRRNSMPGDLRSCASPSPTHGHVRAAQSMGNLHLGAGDFSPYPFPLPLMPAHRPGSPTTMDTRRDSISTFTDTTSFDSASENDELEARTEASVPVPIPSTTPPPRAAVSPPPSIRLEVAENSAQVPAENIETPSQPSTECKEAVNRIKIALEEKASLERRLQELERLISGRNSQRPRERSLTAQYGHPSNAESGSVQFTRSVTTIGESEVRSEPQQSTQGDSSRETSFESENSPPPTLVQSPPVRTQQQQQRQRPQLPQLQTSLPLPAPAVNEERQTPSTAVRLTSAVSRIANWIFGDEEQSAYPLTPLTLSSPNAQRPQHSSVQTFQLIQAHHLQLTPTSPQHHRRMAHRSAPATTASPVPIVGYQQRWRPRNVEDVDPVPPYHEQDPNPSPGFVFFPPNSLLTPLATPTSPSGINLANRMHAQAV